MTQAEFVAWLREQTVECHDCHATGRIVTRSMMGGFPCPTCHGTGRVPNPLAQAVYEAVTEACHGSSYHDLGVIGGEQGPFRHHSCPAPEFCGTCRGTGRALKDFTSIGEYGFVGTVLGACIPWMDSPVESSREGAAQMHLYKCLLAAFWKGSPAQAVMEVVKMAISDKRDAGHAMGSPPASRNKEVLRDYP